MKRWLAPAVFVLLVVGGGYTIWDYYRQPAVPSAFLEARQKSSEISRQLVELTSDNAYKIKDINYLDVDGHYEAALSLVTRAREDNQKAFEETVELSNQLKTMTEIIPEIKSDEKRQMAQEAISLELAMIVHFINYTKAVDDLLLTLKSRFLSPSSKYQREIDVKLSQLNSQALLVNNLNEQFVKKIKEFDEGL